MYEYERKEMGELEMRRKERIKIKGKNESIRPLRMLTVKNAGSKLLIYCDMRKAVLEMSFVGRNAVRCETELISNCFK